MGCDIHWVIECRAGGKWVGYMHDNYELLPKRSPLIEAGIPSIYELSDRNYQFFAKLAGVRGDGPIPNGLPNDISKLTRALANNWDNDGHSHSYLPLYEFVMRYIVSHEDLIPMATDLRLRGEDPVRYWLEERVWVPNNLDNFRVVFWFDN